MGGNPWGRPKAGSFPAATAEEIEAARDAAVSLKVSLRVGYKKGLRANVVAGVNARLAGRQLVKVEFDRIPHGELAELIKALEEGTRSVCVLARGNTATFLRRHPNRPFPDD